MTVDGIDPMWLLRFDTPARETRFLELAAAHGVLFKRGAYNFAALAHDDDAIRTSRRRRARRSSSWRGRGRRWRDAAVMRRAARGSRAAHRRARTLSPRGTGRADWQDVNAARFRAGERIGDHLSRRVGARQLRLHVADVSRRPPT